MLNKTIAAMLLVPLAIVSFASAAWAASDPIPGIDIIVKCNQCTPPVPAGLTRTGRDGRFVIGGLRAGTYTIRIPDGPAPRAIINTSRSNIKKPSSMMVGGVEVVTIEAEMGIGPAEATFMIGADRGRVVGFVGKAAARPR